MNHLFLTSFRFLYSKKMYCAINALGLSVAVAAIALIAMFANYQLKYDQQYAGWENIYRVAQIVTLPDGSPPTTLATSAPQIAGLIKNQYPGILESARLRIWQSSVRLDRTSFSETIGIADPEFISIFTFNWIEGDPVSALVNPNSIVLTEGASERYFGQSSPLGRFLELANGDLVVVTGVIEDVPKDSHLDFDLLVPMSSSQNIFGRNDLENWSLQSFHTYIRTGDGFSKSEIEGDSERFFNAFAGEGAGSYFKFNIMPLSDIHLYSDGMFELKVPGSYISVLVFIGVSILILVIACVNFANLSTALAIRRFREIGLKKVLGATKSQIVLQYLGESTILAFVSMLLGLGLAAYLLPWANSIALTEFQASELFTESSVIFLLVLSLFIGLISGIYPAVLGSMYTPQHLFSGDVSGHKRKYSTKDILVLFQLSITTILLIVTMTTIDQIQFANMMDLGFEKENLLVVGSVDSSGFGSELDSFKNELDSKQSIAASSASSDVPGEPSMGSFFVRHEGDEGERKSQNVVKVDFGYFETYGMKFLAGRAFSKNYSTDQTVINVNSSEDSNSSYIINRAAAEALGWGIQNSIGKWLEVTCCRLARGSVVGVVENIYFESIQNTISPMIFVIPEESGPLNMSQGRQNLTKLTLRTIEGEVPQVLNDLQAAWFKIFGDSPLTYEYLDEGLSRQYEEQINQSNLFVSFSIIAILLSTIGLFSLTIYTVEDRRKELAIRKLLGAKYLQLLEIIGKKYLTLILISFLLSWPASYYFSQFWLSFFAYRVDILFQDYIGISLLVIANVLLINLVVIALITSRNLNESIRQS